MHKHFSARVVAALAIFAIACLGVSSIHAADSFPWISSVLSTQKQADTTALPPTMGGSGNIDCAMEDATNCSVGTNYGAATWGGTVRLASSGSFLPVITSLDSRQHFLPVPNSNMAISYFSGPPFGLDLAFNYNLSPYMTKSNGTFQMTRLPDAKLTDKAKHLLAADTASMSFSENSQWMVVSDPNVAVLRVNLQTFDVLPFASGLSYGIGLDPTAKTAITNDGRYAVVASKVSNTFKLYDLNTCAAVPDTINSAVSCQSRDLNAFMQAALPGYSFVSSARFVDENTVSVYAVYKSGTVNKTARFIISNNTIVNQIDYLALGDSYISGEGAFNYMGGTDTDSNKCHLSFLAYPSLIGQDLNYNSYHSVACSGAVTDDIINTSPGYKGQADNKQISRAQRDANGQTGGYLSSFQPGYIDQLEFVKTYQPRAVTVSIGGNDMGFSNILKTCVDPRNIETCYSTYEDRLELVHQINNTVFPRLIQTYQKIKSAGPPDMLIYVIGYPQIAKPGGDCGLNVHLNSDEILFSQELINYLDTVVQQAASRAGVYYVDTQDALNGHRLCEAGPGSIAVNGLTAGNDRPSKLGGPIADESYHPNDTGYELLENKILSATHNLTDPMPPANLSAAVPSEIGQVILDVPHSGRAINTTELDENISDDLAYQQTPITVSINGAAHNLAPSANLKAEIHSTTISLGTYITDTSGNLTTQILIPASTPAGYHTLHFYGADLSGQAVDIYKSIYIAATADDLDGDGIPDSAQKCIGVTVSGQDFDKDGIDDACDTNITQPPANSPPSLSSATTGDDTTPTDSAPISADGQVSPAGPITATSDESAVPIFVPTSDAGNPNIAGPSVLSAATSKTQTADSASPLGDSTNGKYIFPGILTMLIGTLGLIFKRLL